MKPKSFVPWLVALVIFGPFAAALVIFYASPTLDWLPRLPGSRELIEPPIPAPEAWLGPAFEGGRAPYRWSLIYARMAACDEPCMAELVQLRQVHLALGRDADRVQRIYLVGDESSTERDPAADPGLAARPLDATGSESVLRELGPDQLLLGRVLIADPSGDLIASYPPNVEQKELLRDLKRLLAVSGTN